MLLGAHLAGGAIENSMLGATHAMANPLSAHFNLTHGIAIGVMLPHVIRYNGEAVCELYGDFAAEAGLCSADDPQAPGRLAQFVEKLLAEARCPNNLKAAGADLSLIPVLAEEAASQWTANFNPRPVDRLQFEAAVSRRLPRANRRSLMSPSSGSRLNGGSAGRRAKSTIARHSARYSP